MRIAKKLEYAATPEQVFAVLADEAFQEAKCAATAALRQTVSVRSGPDGTVIRTERVLPAREVPDFARSMVGSELTVTETQDWRPAAADGSRTGSWAVRVAGIPLSLNGHLSLAPAGAGAVELVEGDLKAGIPLFGGKIERAAAPPLEQAIDIEGRLVNERLRRLQP